MNYALLPERKIFKLKFLNFGSSTHVNDDLQQLNRLPSVLIRHTQVLLHGRQATMTRKRHDGVNAHRLVGQCRNEFPPKAVT